MDVLDLTLSIIIIWVAIDVAVVAILMSAAGRREERARRSVAPARMSGLRFTRERPRSARTRA